MNLQPVILSGGSGTRLWPLSREQYPKQLLALTGEDTLLQAAARRVDKSLTAAGQQVLAPIVVGNEDYRFLTAEQLRQAGVVPAAIVLEPVGRNTAPALALAALVALQAGDDPVLVVMPADHVIGDVEAFRAAIAHGAVYAEAGKLVTFGVRPIHPESGYGYIRGGKPLEAQDSGREISAFFEKPDAATAGQYVASGDYLWNSGIFMMRASVWLAQLGAMRPDITEACRAAFAGRSPDRDFLRIGKDAENNVLHGDVMAVATRDTLAISQSRLVALVGLSEAVVVETPDAVLVAHKSRMQQVKDVVARLKREKRPEADAHRKIYRP